MSVAKQNEVKANIDLMFDDYRKRVLDNAPRVNSEVAQLHAELARDRLLTYVLTQHLVGLDRIADALERALLK